LLDNHSKRDVEVGMVRVLVAAVLTAAAATGFASPAAADEAGYLRLQDQLNFLTTQQLLTEGQRVCQATNSGVASPEIVNMVSRDLRKTGLSVASASRIVSTAIAELGC
jgi:Protein of unknown function (DUF732)